mmetsp:Transcript_104874/g.224121  ORF Transcript_104874/g.224121 Transcript_104874/m.224121 type:complete len:204 (-) Transcript_104874:79-690(-)
MILRMRLLLRRWRVPQPASFSADPLAMLPLDPYGDPRPHQEDNRGSEGAMDRWPKARVRVPVRRRRSALNGRGCRLGRLGRPGRLHKGESRALQGARELLAVEVRVRGKSGHVDIGERNHLRTWEGDSARHARGATISDQVLRVGHLRLEVHRPARSRSNKPVQQDGLLHGQRYWSRHGPLRRRCSVSRHGPLQQHQGGSRPC